ncbi:hypothetical protein HNY73_005975 [Argiope bruennichi]|uniref:Uncharacterized protein n=1 Tax=Argiope bruennichi TaxID=94029 RepID=A0A8T0FIF5_ARGBR|nr:hypothetical protein HNY73_005975 [Argiope bruennichi]
MEQKKGEDFKKEEEHGCEGGVLEIEEGYFQLNYEEDTITDLSTGVTYIKKGQKLTPEKKNPEDSKNTKRRNASGTAENISEDKGCADDLPFDELSIDVDPNSESSSDARSGATGNSKQESGTSDSEKPESVFSEEARQRVMSLIFGISKRTHSGKAFYNIGGDKKKKGNK